ERLLLQATDGQHEPAEVDLAGHGDVLVHAPVREEGGEGGVHGAAGGGAVLGHGSGGNVDVDVVFREVLRIDPDPGGAFAHEAPGGLHRFLHHLADLAGELDAALSGEADRLDVEDLAADGGVGEPVDDAGAAREELRLA